MGEEPKEKRKEEDNMCNAKRWFLTGLVSILILILMGGGEEIQSQEKYPSKPINLIVPYTPGGGTDLVARFGAAFLNKKWGVPLNVINKPGGATLPATVDLYRAAPNGYTLFGESQGSTVVLEQTQPDLPIKIMDRTFLGMAIHSPYYFIVPSSSPCKSLEDVIKDAKKNPRDFTWISLGGVGGQDIVTRQFLKAIGVNALETQPVMAKGGSEGASLVAGGHAKLMVGGMHYFRGPLKAGLLKLLATNRRERHPEFPDVPTMAQLGYPTVDNQWWGGFSGPPKIPSHIIEIWENALQELVKDPAYISQTKDVGDAFYLNSRELREYVKKEIEEVKELFPKK